MNLLEVKDICKTYGTGETAVHALKHVNFSVPKGEFVAVVGESGSGKSTLLNMIGALDTPTSGKVLIDGGDIFRMKDEKLTIFRRRNIGFIFQAFNLIPELNVEQNITFPILLDYGKPDQDYVEEILTVLSLQDRRHHLPRQLSGGQQQRVALARILASGPDVLMLDEPFSALDAYLKEELQIELLDILQEYRGDILMVTHSRDEVYRFCNQIHVLDQGKLVASGETKAVFADPQMAAVARLTGCKNIVKGNRLTEHRMKIPAWGMELEFEQKIPVWAEAIGIRAHYLEPVLADAGGNVIACRWDKVLEDPFEMTGILDNGIWWKISKEDYRNLPGGKMPGYLRIPEESILFLRN